MAFGVEYIIGLVDKFSAVAEKVSKSAIDAEKGVGSLGKQAMKVDEQMNKLASGMTGVNKATEGIVKGSKEAANALGQLGQAANKSADEQIAAFRKAAQARYDSKFSNNPRYFNADGSSKSTGPGWFGGKGEGGEGGKAREGKGVGFMGGMFALSMLHNDVIKDWEAFDDEMRRMRGTMAGQLSDADVNTLRAEAIKTAKGTIFSGTDIAKILLAEAERGVPLNERTKDGQLLGAKIAKQMLGIATGTGEDPAETFQTHLAIQQGFKLQFKDFPHISDTIARIHQKTGISLKQIETQMGQIAGPAGTAGWTEEETAAALGLMQKRGVGRLAGTGLRRILEQSTKEWSKGQIAGWKKLGIDQEELKDPKTGGMISPARLAKLLEDHTKGMSKFDVEKVLTQIYGSKAAVVAAQLIGGSKELEASTNDLMNVEGLAEKMGLEGSKGGAAGLKRFAAAWENMKIAIGESGFGEHVGWLASQIGGLVDTIQGRTGQHGSRGMGTSAGDPSHPWLVEALGWTAAALNGLSAAALPIMALQALGAGTALSGAFFGFGRIATGLGAMAARSAGLAGLATSMSRMAVAGRLILGLTGIGTVLLIGAGIVANWDSIAAAADRLWAAISKIKTGDWKGALTDVGKELWKINTDLAKAAGPLPGTNGGADPSKPGILDKIGIDPDASRGVGGGKSARPAPSASAANAAAERLKADINVRTTLDPIQLHVPPTVQLQGTLTGPNGAAANVNGSMPLSATAPRGTTAATPANPQVAR